MEKKNEAKPRLEESGNSICRKKAERHEKPDRRAEEKPRRNSTISTHDVAILKLEKTFDAECARIAEAKRQTARFVSWRDGEFQTRNKNCAGAARSVFQGGRKAGNYVIPRSRSIEEASSSSRESAGRRRLRSYRLGSERKRRSIPSECLKKEDESTRSARSADRISIHAEWERSFASTLRKRLAPLRRLSEQSKSRGAFDRAVLRELKHPFFILKAQCRAALSKTEVSIARRIVETRRRDVSIPVDDFAFLFIFKMMKTIHRDSVVRDGNALQFQQTDFVFQSARIARQLAV